MLLLAGNHDHGLVAGWIDARLQAEPSGFLGLSEPIEPDAGRPARARAWPSSPRPPRLRLAYPGAWLRDDVYAMHGHYVDLHSTVPTFERLAAGAMARWVVRLPEDGARPDDYEAALAPIYAFMHQLTQRSDHAAVSAGAGASARAWVALAGEGRRAAPVRAAALGDAATSPRWPAINALGPRPGRPRPLRPRRCGAAACAASARCCAASASRRRTCCSATRTAPARGRATTRRSGRTPAGTRLHNTGSWVYQPHFLSGRAERVALLARAPPWSSRTSGPPRLIRLLGDRAHAELRPPA